MKKIVFVSHCILNNASKVVMYNEEEMFEEDSLRVEFLLKTIEKDVQIVQLPCPEFTMYGSKRWGHVSDQFDNVFFRKHCRNILIPIIEQIKEYIQHNEAFEVLGVVGIDGSPSCGVDYTCTGDWYGSFESRTNLKQTLNTVRFSKGPGVFMGEFIKMLEEENLNDKVKVTSLYTKEKNKCLDIIK